MADRNRRRLARRRTYTPPRAPRLGLPGPMLSPTSGAALVEIGWRPLEIGAAFQLQAVDGAGERWLSETSPRLAAATAPPPETRGAKKAHAVLRDQLLRQGWERCGHGSEWFSDRFVRIPDPLAARAGHG